MVKEKYSIKDFLPLISIFLFILLFTFVRYYFSDTSSLMSAMSDFMGGFFFILGGLKMLNWKNFVKAYRMYDLVAKKSELYAYAYPLIEISLGVLYLFKLYPLYTNVFTFFLMLISSIGVANELKKKNKIVCACLGVVFKVPMTWVTLLEDILMVIMAGMMICFLVG